MRRILRIIFIFLIFIMIIIPVSCIGKKISDDEKVLKYYDKNSVRLTFKDDNELSAFKDLNRDISKYKVFLFGYENGSKINGKIELKFLRYLNKTADVTNYIGSMQYSEGAVINKYIQSGNASILDNLFKLYKGTEKWTSENYQKWMSLNAYNAILEDDKKIRIYGLGMEENPAYSFLYLSLILPKDKAPDNISDIIEAIRSYEKIDGIESIRKIINDYEISMRNFSDTYEKYLGDSFTEFKYVMEELKDVISLFDNGNKKEEYYVYNEEKMYSNFLRIYSNIGLEKFYGNFPTSQIFKKREGSDKHIINSFAERINSKNSPIAGKVLSTECLYENSSRLFADKEYNYVPLNSTAEGMDVIAKKMTSNVTILKMNKLFSPFKNYAYLVDKADNGVTSDYFNYAIFIKDSDAENPIKLTDYDEVEERLLGEYLKSNCSSIVTDVNDISSFKLLNDDVSKYDVFFAGETHGVSFNTNIEISILKYLNQMADVRYYIGEFGYSSGIYINKYLDTGDEGYLKELYNELKGTSLYNKESYDKWKKIYEYNKGLPEGKKIKVIGIDIEHQMNTAWRYLNSIIPNDKPPVEIEDIIEKLRDKVCAGSETEDKQLLTKLFEETNAHQNSFKNYFKIRYFDFDMITRNILNAINMYQGMGYNFREAAIYQNFKDVYEYYSKGKYFGQLSSEHTLQHVHENQWITNESFAARLKKNDSPVNGRVSTILYIYTNCMKLVPQKNQEMVCSNYGETLLLNSFSDSNYTLFKLDGSDSPFEKKPYIIDSPKGGITTDYFQYVIVIKNSPPALLFTE